MFHIYVEKWLASLKRLFSVVSSEVCNVEQRICIKTLAASCLYDCMMKYTEFVWGEGVKFRLTAQSGKRG